MDETRYGREFGKGTLLGDSGEEFISAPLEEQVKMMGWSHACPSIDTVVKDYGPEWTLKRYAECNFVFGLIVEAARDRNPQLYEELTTPIERLSDEPVGRHDPKYVPSSHKSRMSPLSTLWGYALPRVVIEQMGRSKNNEERTPERILKAFKIIDQKVSECKTPVELVVRLAEAVLKENVDPKAVLSHLFSKTILEEENCKTMFRDTIAEMEKSAPLLTQTHRSLSPQEADELDIAILK